MTSLDTFMRSRGLNPDNMNILIRARLRTTIPRELCRSLRQNVIPRRLILGTRSQCLRQLIKRRLTNRRIIIARRLSHLNNSSNLLTGGLAKMVRPRPLSHTATVIPRSTIHRDTDLQRSLVTPWPINKTS